MARDGVSLRAPGGSVALPTSQFQSNETDFERVGSGAVREYIPAALGSPVCGNLQQPQGTDAELSVSFCTKNSSSQRGLRRTSLRRDGACCCAQAQAFLHELGEEPLGQLGEGCLPPIEHTALWSYHSMYVLTHQNYSKIFSFNTLFPVIPSLIFP